jgi:DNA modification methylase
MKGILFRADSIKPQATMSEVLNSRVVYEEPYVTLYCGHALEILRAMPSESVDMVMTSPPYWGLRTYKTEPQIWDGDNCEHEWGPELVKPAAHKAGETNPCKEGYTKNQGAWSDRQGRFCLKCHGWRGELGLEPTIELYISHLVQVFDEVKRILKSTGTCWVNIDDTYAGSNCGYGDYRSKNKQSLSIPEIYGDVKKPQAHINLPAKSLCLIPSRFALAMVQHGWRLRNDICWHKPNPMPESIRDRFTTSWEHLFFFVKSRRYFFEQQFEPYTEPLNRWAGPPVRPNELRRNKRDVWIIPTSPFSGAHFAVFSEKLCETPILAGCPSHICKKCGKAREKIYRIEPMKIRRTDWGKQAGNRTASSGIMLEPNKVEFQGYTDCGCEPKEYEPGIVLDPFCGSGTTLAVAKKLASKAIGIELNPNYCKLAIERIRNVPVPMEL